MNLIMQNEPAVICIPWLKWARRHAVLLAALGALFLIAKGYPEDLLANAEPWRSIRMFSHTILLLALGVASITLAGLAWQISRLNPSLRSWEIWLGLTVFLLFILTTLPIGNHWKFGSLYYEDWIWLSAFWLINLGLACALSGWAIARHEGSLERIGEALERRSAWAFSLTHTRADVCLLVGLTAFVASLCLAFNATLFGGIPHVHDSVAQYVQAQIFARGAFAAPAPTHVQFFERVFLLIVDDRWFSIYPPGHALVLSLGAAINAPWLINPIVAATSIPLLYVLAARLYGYPTARLASLLWALSPFHLFMGAEYMNHTTSLFFILIFLIALFSTVGQTNLSKRASLVAGFAFAFAAITRPFSALALGAIAVAWAAARLSRPVSILPGFAALFLLGALPVAAFNLAYNLNTTGDPLVSGYQRYFGGSPLGFGERPWGTEPLAHGVPNVVQHTPLRGLANTFCNFNALNLHLFGWPIASLAFAFALFMPRVARRRDDWFCLAGALAMPAAYFFYFYQDYCFGPRFYYESAPFWVLLSARGVFVIAEVAPVLLRVSASVVRAVMTLLIALLFVFAIITTWIALIHEYGDDYWGVRQETAQMLHAELGNQNALVFVEYDYDYNAVFTSLDPWMESGPIVALDLGDEMNRKLMRAYPKRSVYRLYLEPDGPSSDARTLIAPYNNEGLGMRD